MHFLVAVICLVLLPVSVSAEKRLALIIGNDAYSDVPELQKAGADATAISAALEAQRFGVLTVLDASRREMNRQIALFTNMLEPGDTAFVFYAGHGVEIDGENYLLPTDIVAPASGDRDFIKSESIALSNLLDRVRATGARTTIAVIDACRNNPFEASTGRSIGSTRGLGRITAPEGTFVIFSAGAGQLALDQLTKDDPDPNSVFTRKLLPYLSDPDLELRAMMASLRVDVRNLARTVNHEQFPAYYDELLGEFFFAATPAAPIAASEPAPMAPTTAPTRDIDRMREDFELARNIGTPAALRTFLNTYHSRRSEFSYRMAQQMLDQMAPAQNAPQADESAQVAALAPPVAPVTSGTSVILGTGDTRRAIIRHTQTALNSAGCSAGGADGVIGPRTRRAFARFITDSGAALKPGDLGTQKALKAVVGAGHGTCKAITATAPSGTVAAPETGPAAGLNIAGRWRYRATCALLLKVTGSVRYTRTGPNTFHGQLADSLGQNATVRVTLNGRAMRSTLYFSKFTVTTRGTLSVDGNSFSDVGSTGCTSTAWRVGG